MTRPLTKEGLKQFSLKRVIFGFIEHFNTCPELHDETREHRLSIELAGLKIKPRDYSYHHASSLNLGDKELKSCMRQMAYSIANKEPSKKEWDALFLNKFETGHDAHGKYQGWLSFIYGNKFEREVPFNNKALNIGGTCDGILHIELDGAPRQVGIEIKTASDSVIKKLKRPSNRYLDQGATYAHSLGLDAIIFLYEAKNTQELFEFPYLTGELESRWKLIEERVTEINDHLERGTWPRRNRSTYLCRDCAFTKECRPNKVRKVNRAKMQPLVKKVMSK